MLSITHPAAIASLLAGESILYSCGDCTQLLHPPCRKAIVCHACATQGYINTGEHVYSSHYALLGAGYAIHLKQPLLERLPGATLRKVAQDFGIDPTLEFPSVREPYGQRRHEQPHATR